MNTKLEELKKRIKTKIDKLVPSAQWSYRSEEKIETLEEVTEMIEKLERE